MGKGKKKKTNKSDGSSNSKKKTQPVVDSRFDTSKPQFRQGNNRDRHQRRQQHDDDDDANAAASSASHHSRAAAAAAASNNASNNNSNNNKVVLDERFASVLTDPRFQLHVHDKYGRPSKADAAAAAGKTKKNKRSKTKQQPTSTINNELAAFYQVADEQQPTAGQQTDDDGHADVASDDKKKKEKEKRHAGDDGDGGDDSDSSSSSPAARSDNAEEDQEDDEDPVSRIAYLTALSRGELDVSSSSSSSSESESSEDEDEDDDDDQDDARSHSSSDDDDGDGDEERVEGAAAAVADGTGVLDPSPLSGVGDDTTSKIELTEQSSPYMAVMNMDWSNVRAVDIYSILASFTPPGSVKSVQIYPSDFGLARFDKEHEHGPTGLWKQQQHDETKDYGDNDNDADPTSDDDDGSDSGSEEGSNAEEPDDHDDGSDEESVDQLPDDADAFLPKNDHVESDFDQEKLRVYEASKLKYYFAVVEFAHPQAADTAYREVDGLEFEHSSASMDLRIIPPSDLAGVVDGRTVRDEARTIPSNYVPPDFIINALQHTNVQCTWEMGDRERERMLTKYASSGQQAWGESIAEADDLRAYLASDDSSDDDGDDGADSRKKGDGNAKAKSMRKMLGLDSDEDDEAQDARKGNSSGEESSSSSGSDSDNSGREDQLHDGVDDDTNGKEMRFIPGKTQLQDKIRSKLDATDEDDAPLTPWEKYQQKRKEKRREKRQAARAKRKDVNVRRKSGGIGDNRDERDMSHDDSFFFDDNGSTSAATAGSKPTHVSEKHSNEELELLVAGEDSKEAEKDYDIRGLQRIEKNRDKKLRGSRKRKEEKLAAGVTGADFKVNVQDDRFSLVLDGVDDRFGIDRTDPQYKETAAMKEILAEQTQRRKHKRRKRDKPAKEAKVAPDVSADAASSQRSSGAAALSALVSSLKSKVGQ